MQNLQPPHRTRIKICGLTRPEDVRAAVDAGVDAIGLVFYEPSPRYVTVALAATLARDCPPLINLVGLFVNATPAQVEAVCAAVPLSLLQFHGDETPEQCNQIAELVQRPFLRAARVTPTLDLVKFAQQYAISRLSSKLLLDTFAESYGGSGKVFDWSLIPAELASQAVLSGGLNAQNVAEAIVRVRPYAVDVSSGVETAKGIKDHALIRRFVQAVQSADQSHS